MSPVLSALLTGTQVLGVDLQVSFSCSENKERKKLLFMPLPAYGSRNRGFCFSGWHTHKLLVCPLSSLSKVALCSTAQGPSNGSGTSAKRSTEISTRSMESPHLASGARSARIWIGVSRRAAGTGVAMGEDSSS